MSIFDDFLTRLPQRMEPGENEYMGDDGLLYCSKCKTPVQCRVKVGSATHIVPCICKCRMAEMERRNRIHSLKVNGIQEKVLYNWTFANAEDNPSIQMARRYVANWSEAKQKNLGLLLWGDVGTGKSYVAACIANALLESGAPVLMTNFSKILNQMGGMYSQERYQYIASFSSFDLLIIDDLGIERSTEYALEQVYAVVDERYKSNKPLTVTTNLTINQMGVQDEDGRDQAPRSEDGFNFPTSGRKVGGRRPNWERHRRKRATSTEIHTPDKSGPRTNGHGG